MKTCETCGKTLVKQQRRFCSRSCKGVWQKAVYSKGRISKTCEQCGKNFQIEPSHANRTGYRGGRFCSKRCMGLAWGMDGSQNWKGGRYNHRGYIQVMVKNHPAASKGGYVPEHRLIMEAKLGRYLQPHEHIHHLNGIKSDNRPENLSVVHTRPHYGTVDCPACGHVFHIR